MENFLLSQICFCFVILIPNVAVQHDNKKIGPIVEKNFKFKSTLKKSKSNPIHECNQVVKSKERSLEKTDTAKPLC